MLCHTYVTYVLDYYTVLQYLCQGYLRVERRLSKQVNDHSAVT